MSRRFLGGMFILVFFVFDLLGGDEGAFSRRTDVLVRCLVDLSG
jgi:hypothetical protein